LGKQQNEMHLRLLRVAPANYAADIWTDRERCERRHGYIAKSRIYLHNLFKIFSCKFIQYIYRLKF